VTDPPWREIEQLDGVETRRDAVLAPLTTFRIGGPADLLVVPRSLAGLEETVRIALGRGVPLLVIGGGSDLLIADRGFAGVALKIPAGLTEVRVEGERMHADAGRGLPELMRRARRAGLRGLEFAGGIPGSLGGSLAVNAGAWGREMAEVAVTVRGVDARGERVEVDAGQIAWSYRRADFPAPLVITAATLALEPDSPERIAAREEAWHGARRQSQPLGEPSAGCVFRNPHGTTGAGGLIDAAGLKDERVGGARVSPIHANFIVNDGGATAADVTRLIERVRERVLATHGVELELEIKLIGHDGRGVQGCVPISAG
jgi:UDP-N-acetylmuramate dehydrogenase